MKNLVRQAIIAAAAVVGTVGAASAADVWVPPARGPIVEPAPVEFGSNWYLRADVGYRMPVGPTAECVAVRLVSLCDGPIEDEDLAESWTVGVGAGYRFSPWIRADVTADYATPADFRGTYDSGFGPEEHRAELSSWTVMANAYVDLGTWNRITPYVGAGIGGAHHSLRDYRMAGLGGLVHDSEADWELAWAVMAGVAYDVTPNLAVDLGYRYISMGEVTTTDTLGLGDLIRVEDLDAHEARIGVRYMIN